MHFFNSPILRKQSGFFLDFSPFSLGECRRKGYEQIRASRPRCLRAITERSKKKMGFKGVP